MTPFRQRHSNHQAFPKLMDSLEMRLPATHLDPIVTRFGMRKAAPMHSLRTILLLVFLLSNVSALAQQAPERRPELSRIGHIIVIFLENRSFDHLYGLFP